MRKKILSPKVYPLSKDLAARWYVRGWKTANGKQKRVHCWVESLPTVEQRVSAAQKIIDNWQTEFVPFVRENRLFSTNSQIQHLMNFLEEIRPSLRRKTYLGYRSQIRTLERYCQEKNIITFDNGTARTFLADMLKTGKSSSTVNAYRVTFKGLFARLLKEKRIKNNPFAQTDRVKGYSNGSHYFKTHQISQLKSYMLEKTPFLWVAVRFMYYCYIRPGELRLLKIGDIDFDDWQIKVRGAVSKNKREQWVAIPEALRRELEPLCLYQYPADYYVVGKNGEPNATPVAFNYWTRWHLNMLTKLGYSSDYNLYSWKHTGVVRAYKAGIGLKELQLQLRHHSLDMVKIYLESLGILDFKNIKEVFPAI